MDKREYYLSHFLKDIELENNTLVVAPTGSGKTKYIFNHLAKNGRFLYLCDNENLKTSIEQEKRTFSNRKGIEGFDDYSINVMCYKEFGDKVKYNNDFLKQYEAIFCDEIHNLIDYQSFKDDADLSHAIKELFKRYDETKIFYFTATPSYLEIVKKLNSELEDLITVIDYSEEVTIMRYINKRKAFINHIDQIKFQLKQYHEGFKFGGLKCLIFTREISRMKYIEEMVESEQIKVICIWSKHNKDNDLSDEQKRVRDHLIRYGTLPDPYNVLIINRALETGINITDKKMDLAIVNTTNETQQIQVRGRLRHDIDLLVCRTSDIKNMPDIPVELDHTWLNKNLTAQDKNDLADELKITDGKGRHLKWSTVKKILLENNYEVKEKSVQEDLKKKRVSVITKNKQISC